MEHSSMRWCFENLGWAFTPLRGKIPQRKGWQTEEPLGLETLLAWDGNIGLRTGSESGVVVVDIDKPGQYDLPKTVTVRTGKGKHLYYAWEGDPLSGRVGKIFDGVDVRAEGNQVVFPGSVHPETGAVYEFVQGLAPWDIPLAQLPQWIASACRGGRVSDEYLRKAIDGEVAKVLSAEKGTRNNTLNCAAFSIGTILGTGLGSHTEAETALVRAGIEAGLTPAEVHATVLGGIEAGMAQPRDIRPSVRSAVAGAAAEDGHPLVVVPCVWYENGVKRVRRNGEFVEDAISKLPKNLVLSRGGLPGILTGERGEKRWEILTADVARVLLDQHMNLARWTNPKPTKDEPDPSPKLVPLNCNRDLAGMVVENMGGRVPELHAIVTYPVYGQDWDLQPPGFHDGIYYDQPKEFEGLVPQVDSSDYGDLFNHLLADFPFATKSDETNFIGLMLTPIIAFAVRGNRPIHLITASIERTGKSKLAQDVLGGVLLGRSTPSMQLTGNEEERDKRIASVLLEGSGLLCIDNVPEKLASPALAALTTAETYSARLLGRTQLLRLRNGVTTVATGNNTWCSGELAKRIVPIVLQPSDDKPERRTDFLHPDLGAWIRQNRLEVVETLVGMVERWKAHGMKRSNSRPMGGFEGWASVLQGIFESTHYRDWRANEDSWRRQSDDDTSLRERFVSTWYSEYGTKAVKAIELLELCEKSELFGWIFERKSKNGQCQALANWLRQHISTPIKCYRIVQETSLSGKPLYKLDKST